MLFAETSNIEYFPEQFASCYVTRYICKMIVSIRHKGLKQLWTNNNPSKLPVVQIKRIRLILTLLNGSVKIDDMDFPGSGLHPLKGDLKGFWSVVVTGNYRIIFRFENEDVYDIDYIDYH